MDVVDFTNYMATVQIKDARDILMQMIPAIMEVVPNNILFDMISFDGTSSVRGWSNYFSMIPYGSSYPWD